MVLEIPGASENRATGDGERSAVPNDNVGVLLIGIGKFGVEKNG
jgi:hypothetical protein